MTRTALVLASLLTLDGSLAAASMPTPDCTARKACTIDLRLLPPPDPDTPALPLTPASLRDAGPVRASPPRGAQ